MSEDFETSRKIFGTHADYFIIQYNYDLAKCSKYPPVLRFTLGLLVLLSLVYLILVSLTLLTAGVHLTFTPQVVSLVNNNALLIEKNDIVGFCLGQLSTALLQSSSVRPDLRNLSL